MCQRTADSYGATESADLALLAYEIYNNLATTVYIYTRGTPKVRASGLSPRAAALPKSNLETTISDRARRDLSNEM